MAPALTIPDRALRRWILRKGPWGALALVCALTWLAAGLDAKEKKPVRLVRGVVSDAVENPIPGAAVTLTDLQTGKKTATYTGADGAYLFSGLEMTRDYDVQATFKDLASRVRRVSTIDPRNQITLNLRIPPPKEEE